ncbi:MAG: hypothetical protein Q7J47_16735 [Azoarcus sp.]|nr:hypothetical protein [Azoarcus sp.]
MLMFDKAPNPGPHQAADRWMKMAAMLGATIALTLPISTLANASTDNGALVKTAMQPKAETGVSGAARSGYELRCWQEGRLILQEHFLRAPPESSADALRMNDGAGRPVRVLETANATCLLKAVPTPPRTLRP